MKADRMLTRHISSVAEEPVKLLQVLTVEERAAEGILQATPMKGISRKNTYKLLD